MKRIILLGTCAVILMGIHLFVSCSNPLEPTGQEGPDPIGPITDTVFVYDTVIVESDTIYSVDTLIVEGDTIYSVDTLIIEGDTVYTVDTLTITDTVTVVDTVVIYEPDPGEWETICSILLANLREIIWMFDNQEGTYDFRFTATATRDFSSRDLIVNIDGNEYTWNPLSNPEFSVEQLFVNADATIRVKPAQPLLLGHQVDICLTITKRQ